jgi:hypothetical protein
MIRRFVLVFVCGVLALAGSATFAGAQDAARPPNELWDEFPLEPTATPAAAAATQTPTPEVVEVKEPSGGMSPIALIGLVLFAGAVGGLAARLAARRLPSQRVRATGGELAAERQNGTAPITPPRASALLDAPTAQTAPDPRAPAEPAPGDDKPPVTAPPPPPPPPQRRRIAARPKQPARPRPEPPVAPPREPRPRRFQPTGTAPAAWQACSIKLQKRAGRGRFCALAGVDQRVIAYSPVFALDPGDGAPAALKVLVDELHRDGWRQTAVGAKPWQRDFRRAVDVSRPAGR